MQVLGTYVPNETAKDIPERKEMNLALGKNISRRNYECWPTSDTKLSKP